MTFQKLKHIFRCEWGEWFSEKRDMASEIRDDVRYCKICNKKQVRYL